MMGKSDTKITIDDLFISNKSTITIKDAAAILGIGNNSALIMAKEQRFPFVDCVIKVGDENSKGQYKILRVKFLKNITGETYEEQIHYRKELLKERTLDKLISTISTIEE